MKIRNHVAAILIAIAILVAPGLSEELTVYAAASLTGAFSEIGAQYKNETNTGVAFNFDGSQSLRAQIENGAYADVFASANMKQMNALKGNGLMNNSSIMLFAKNRLSLIVPKGNPAGISNLSDLSKPGLKIVVGTKDVPVGDYAMQIIRRLGNGSSFGPEYEARVEANIVSMETNVNYVVTKIALGEADVGFAYVSDVTADLASKIDKVNIQDEYNIIAEYPIGILKDTEYSEESQNFIKFVTSDSGAAILEKYGFIAVRGGLEGASNASVPLSAA